MIPHDGIELSELDNKRLNVQLEKVKREMGCGGWFTLQELSEKVGAPTASISARIRDLRKTKFGGHQVLRRKRERGVFEYMWVKNENACA